MITFESDYTNGAHPAILQKFLDTNDELLNTYGFDKYSESAKEKIKAACQCPNAEVHFLTGGTQTNSIIISTMLKDYEGVVAADTGHISAHEAGAIEYTGHKVLNVGQELGKIKADELEKYLDTFFSDENHEHMVFPGMVYISHPTEYGTLYSKRELEELSNICGKYEIPLYMDGARLGYGLMSYDTDVTLADIARYCDVFYIGGTKVGALCGEAVVFTKNNAPKHFMTMVKQHCALLAKGRLLGVQFDALFTDDLYYKISRHAIDMAVELKKVLQEKGCRFFIDSPTNQQFIIIEDSKLNSLKEVLKVSFWEKYDENHSVVRFATSWSTKPEDIEALKEVL